MRFAALWDQNFADCPLFCSTLLPSLSPSPATRTQNPLWPCATAPVSGIHPPKTSGPSAGVSYPDRQSVNIERNAHSRPKISVKVSPATRRLFAASRPDTPQGCNTHTAHRGGKTHPPYGEYCSDRPKIHVNG